MTEPSVAPGLTTFDRLLGRTFWFLGQAALVLLVWMCVVKFPNSPASDLDPSWRMVLGYAELHNFQFGTDLIFTYGPLGYLLPATNIGDHYWHHLVWQFAGHGVFALAVYFLGRLLTGWRRGLYYVYFIAFGVGYMDVVHMIAVLLLALALLRERIVARRWLAALLALFLAVLALVKFTNLLLAAFAVACVVVHYAWRRRWREAGLVAGFFGAGFFGGWVACGQHLGNLSAYILNSLDVSNGYAEGMGIYGPGSAVALGLGAVLCLAAYYALTVFRAPNQPRAIAAAVIALAASYLNWKHGFVRADGHVLAHFFLCLFFVVSAPVLLQDEAPLRRTKGTLLAVAGLLSFVGIWQASSITVTDVGTALNYRIKENCAKLADLPKLCQLAREEFGSVSAVHQMPATRSIVGKGSIDVLGNEQAYALFNGLNYRPRPVFQGYFPYTEHLQRMNEAFMRSDRAPDYILQKVQTIDYRLPSLDDSLVTRYLYHHYTFMMEDHEFLLWRRNPPNPALDQKTLLSQSKIKFGERLTAPALDDTPVWCELDIQPSWLGRIRAFFYKPPLLQIAVSDGGDSNNSYRLVSSMARAGFLLYPHFTSTYNIRHFQAGGPGPRIAWFSVEVAPEYRKYFKSRIGVRLYQLPPFPRSQSQEGSRPEIRYRVFSQPPISVSAPFPTDILLEGSKEVLLAHPPSTLEFELASRDRHITGKFGLVSKAYTNGNTTDGAEFIVEWVNARGEVKKVFSRLLQPLTVPADRGEQEFDFYVPAGGGRLLLRTTPGPAGDIAFDWTYWTDVKFAP